MVSVSSCLTEDTIAALLDGHLDGHARRRAHFHLAECTTCRHVWMTAGQTLSYGLPHDSEPTSSERRPLDPPTLPRGTSVGRFVILEVIGTGGMSVVYSAYDPELDRKVALKFLRLSHPHCGTDTRSDPELQALRRRLQREAQAMARLCHPCVITVHDIGTFEGDLFIAMEFIDGGTLAEWCRERPRSTREILAMWRRLGQGLAAAHRVGIVHRDFKPSNVLIGRQGDARITDFGLASLHRETEPASLPAVDAMAECGLSSSITRSGMLVGTPAYMAPEQFAGQTVDARADQFSFCVTLYEALYGVRPFVGDSVAELAKQVQSGATPASEKLPSVLRRVLLRGLSRDPAQRYASMDALLLDLTADPHRPLRRALYGLAAAGALATAMLAGYSVRRAPAAICQGAALKLAGIWDEGRKATLRDVFLRSQRSFAATAFQATDRSLSAYADRFVAMHTHVCEATRVRAEQSEHLLDLRMDCLEQRRQELQAVTDLFIKGDPQVIERAQRIVASLPDLEACTQTSQLLAVEPPPTDPTLRARHRALDSMLARIHVLHSAGHVTQGLQQIAAILPSVLELKEHRLRAEYQHILGRLQDSAGRYDEAENSYRDALLSAEVARHDVLVAQAWIHLMSIYGNWHPRDAQNDLLQRHARAAIERLHDPADLLAAYHVAQGLRYSELGQPVTALAFVLKALPAYERIRGPEHYDTARVLMNLGSVYRQLGRLTDSEASHRRALAIADKLFGPEHPFGATIRTNLANALNLMGRPTDALPLLDHALAVYASGSTQPSMHQATTILAKGTTLALLGRYDDARAWFSRALTQTEAVLGPESPTTCTIRRNIGEALLQQGHPHAALPYYEHARRTAVLKYGPDHPEVAAAESGIASVQLRTGNPQRALELFDRAQALFLKNQPTPDMDALEAMLGSAESLLKLGRREAAQKQLARVLSQLPAEHVPANARLRSRAEHLLADAATSAGQPVMSKSAVHHE